MGSDHSVCLCLRFHWHNVKLDGDVDTNANANVKCEHSLMINKTEFTKFIDIVALCGICRSINAQNSY